MVFLSCLDINNLDTHDHVTYSLHPTSNAWLSPLPPSPLPPSLSCQQHAMIGARRASFGTRSTRHVSRSSHVSTSTRGTNLRASASVSESVVRACACVRACSRAPPPAHPLNPPAAVVGVPIVAEPHLLQHLIRTQVLALRFALTVCLRPGHGAIGYE